MIPRSRRKRAILRDRRRDDHHGAYEMPILQPMTGWDLFLIQKYTHAQDTVRTLAQIVRPPQMSPEMMEAAVNLIQGDPFRAIKGEGK